MVDYQLPDGTAGRFTLDDFLYQRQPIDEIFNAVMAAVEAPATDVPPVQADPGTGSL